jgi:sporulation protein YlmC with PRC-barrel domain
MLKAPLTLGLAAAGLMIGPALAQSGNPPSPNPASETRNPAPTDARSGQFLAQMPNTSMRLSKLIGVEVIGLDHKRIGEIDEIVLTGDGRIEAVVIGVGGFLGIGEKNVAVPYGTLLWNTGEPSQAASPSATPGNAPSQAAADATGPEKMPGAAVSDRVLSSTAENRSGTVNPDSGPVTTGATARGATVPVMGAGGPERAMVRLTKADLERAPAFRFGREGAPRQ